MQEKIVKTDKNSLLHEYRKYHVEKIGHLRDVTSGTEISVCDKYMIPCLCIEKLCKEGKSECFPLLPEPRKCQLLI